MSILPLLTAWFLLVAATPLPLVPPPPDLTPLVSFVSAPLDKPPLKLPPVALPAPPLKVPAVPPAMVVLPAADKPTAPLPPPRTLPCVGAWTGAVSESLECGRARFQRGELEDAARTLEPAVRNGTERELVTEARYWLAETLYRLGRIDRADVHFRQVAQERSPHFAPFALHSSGWTALILGDAARARDAFSRILSVTHPTSTDAWAGHGLGLALYALGQYAEAQRAWADLLVRRPPPVIERDVLFWNGDALGRTGEHDKAVAELSRFTQGGPHPLRAAGLVRLGWWSLAAGRAPESLAALRAYAGARPPEAPAETAKPVAARASAEQEAADRDWVDAGLALGLLATDDWNGARAAAQSLDARRSPLVLPLQLRLTAGALVRGASAAADASIAELLSRTLTPPVRAWLLAVKGDAAHAEGKGDDARTQYDLARGIDAGTETGRYATLRLAQTNLEMREFTQVLADLSPLLNAPLDPSMRAAVLLLEGEAAYHAGDYKTAASAFERALAEGPDRPQAGAVRLGLAWTALREGRADEAGRRFVEFARLYPEDEQTADALVLASEMALGSGHLEQGRELLDQVLSRYPRVARTDFARLNRAILMLRSGDSAAQPLLRDWISRAPFPPLLGRAHVALGITLLVTGKPADAAREFAAAQREGMGAVATLGRASAALVEGKLDDAARSFTEARNEGTAPVAAVAEYGLAAVGFQRAAPAAFKTSAVAALDAAPRSPMAPRLLYALAGLAADQRDWAQALAMAKRLVADFPGDERADDALERIGGAAARERIWPVAYEAYALLRQKYPRSPFVEDSRLAFAEAQVATGRAAEGRKTLEQLLPSAAPGDPRAAQARIALGRARELTGDRAGALDAYAQAAREVPSARWSTETLFGYARLLTQERRYDEARGVLEPLVRSAPAPLAAEGALALGETLQAQGDGPGAVEYFMTAAYVAPDSAAGRRALVAAGRAFAALREPDAAATVYRKLLAQSNVPPDLVTAARQGLAELGR